ncbi:hypothetical protein [Sporomusa acidovorans]|uniref:Uncharacterized protein n=1 Tax=Sporomusa acidovorans (strain ATCC 49682 / DSM 3132 / Mol) TaxID=1123286 RepID=A0ABZ3J1R4_SPOA4|nr:hypothetical protein [Sporomusa acidovorans]OZC14803.1 hypothetical protein SPACI_51900 [Sporomusa acidovorans DSM 3132]SDF86638.1 hypothetical protein SAMN04488499_11083 [Sporomusa acidovorans]
MNSQQWTLLANWPINNKRRVILKDKGPHLIDITSDETTINEIIAKVLCSSWSKDELMAYLNNKELAATDKTGSRIVDFIARRNDEKNRRVNDGFRKNGHQAR